MGAIEAIIARRELARQVAEALAALPPVDMRGMETARRVLGGEIDSASELLAIQPDLEQAADQLARLADDSEQVTKRCTQLTPQPSPRLPRGF